MGSRLHYLVAISLGLFLLFGHLASGASRLTTWAWVDFGATALLLALALYSIIRIRKAIDHLTAILKAAARGSLDQRLTGIKTGAATGELAWAVNDLLDQQEAYFREVLSAFEHATHGQTYRLAMEQGLHGSFKDAIVRVNVSVESLGQVQQMALKEKLIGRITDLNSGNLIANLKSIQEYLMDMTQELSIVGQISKETARDAEGSRATIENLVANLNQVAEMIARTNAQTTLLHEKGEEINQIVQVITDVADRTNLLALNAAIEAAHAGEIGKGFAVVAEEVRTLSENTKDAAASIAATIESFGEATSRMIKDSEQVKDIAEGSRNAVTEFRAQVLKFADSANTSLTQINKAQDFSFASLVKVDHFLFKQNGYRVIHQGAQSAESRAIQTDHRGCRLGTWYYEGQGAEMFSHVPSFNRLEAPHARVHQHIQEAAGLLAGGWEKDSEVQNRIYGHYEAAERASEEVVQVLDRMVEERHRAV
ncbi:MAG: CZB domain-containing protein [Geothrix sp.]|uniref:methyl-accepting chemotaxis protein n=1 Tax=Geothrix sp. TaxID=1962974 RepID=UPI00178D14CC|nr:methyl-accepting chemotaxis protein [Geothrix sp.]NWJ42051.1 CZB domain-containing protein [Geothrix sp.]WIL19981.1 MAG: methyl-accepting chemotaxis protein [Geothrix sp.]